MVSLYELKRQLWPSHVILHANAESRQDNMVSGSSASCTAGEKVLSRVPIPPIKAA